MSKLVEEWRPVVGYEEYYEVSDWGNVRSLDRVLPCRSGERVQKGRILKKVLTTTGYHVVTLHDKNHKQHMGRVHRLVAEAFLPNPENKPVVGHTKTMENGLEDKTANEAWHIAWMTQEENSNYGTLPERLSESKLGDKNPMKNKDVAKKVGEKNREHGKKRYQENPKQFLDNMSKNRDKAIEKSKIKINQYLITGEFVCTWPSAADIERSLGIRHTNIAACCRGKIKTTGGYKWEYYV